MLANVRLIDRLPDVLLDLDLASACGSTEVRLRPART